MKPLQTLDHVMLWIARGYAIFTLGIRSFLWFKFATEPAPSFASAPNTVITYHGPTASLEWLVVLSLLLTIGLFTLEHSIGRVLVITSAVSMMAMSIYGTGHILALTSIATSVNPAFYPKLKLIALGCACTITIQLGNILLAVRRISQPKQDDGDRLPPSVAFQSI